MVRSCSLRVGGSGCWGRVLGKALPFVAVAVAVAATTYRRAAVVVIVVVRGEMMICTRSLGPTLDPG